MNVLNFIKENKRLIIATMIVAIILFMSFFMKSEKRDSSITKDDKTIHYQLEQNKIEAKSYYVYDISNNKTIFYKNEHQKLPLASITKLMSGFVAEDVLPETTIITITKEDIFVEGDSGLIVGEKWKLNDLLNFSLISSSNDGMHAIASALNYFEEVNNKDIIKMMNEKAVLLGMNDTVFINETGLDIDKNISGAYSSAYDISILLANILKNNPNLISATNRRVEKYISESGIEHIANNTNTSMNEISGLVASKTGFTDLAGGNLAVIFDAGIMHPIAVVVLGSSEEGRFEDVTNLAKITLEKLSE